MFVFFRACLMLMTSDRRQQNYYYNNLYSSISISYSFCAENYKLNEYSYLNQVL